MTRRGRCSDRQMWMVLVRYVDPQCSGIIVPSFQQPTEVGQSSRTIWAQGSIISPGVVHWVLLMDCLSLSCLRRSPSRLDQPSWGVRVPQGALARFGGSGLRPLPIQAACAGDNQEPPGLTGNAAHPGIRDRSNEAIWRDAH